MARLVKHKNHKILHFFAKRAGNGIEVVSNRRVKIHHIPGLSGHNQFLHVITGAWPEHAAAWRHRHNRNGVGAPIGQQICALNRIHGHIKGRPVAAPKLFAIVKHGGVVFLALANHDFSVKVHAAETNAHGIHGRAVAGFLVAASKPARRGQGRSLRYAYYIQGQISFRRFCHDMLPL